MVILKIWFSEYPWDVRVEKVLDALMEGGHTVHLLCRNNFGQDRLETLKLEGGECTIHRLPFLRGKIGKGICSILTKLINLPAFFNPVWIYSIFKIALQHKADVILVRDLPLTLPAILVGKILRRKVVFDMAECHPEIFKNYFRWGVKSIFIENPWVGAFVERLTIRYIDYVFVMCEESKQRLLDLGMSEFKVAVAGNTARIVPHAKPIKPRSEIRIIYVGMIGEFRGLDTVIDAMPALLGEHKLNVYIDIVGSIGGYLNNLKIKVNSMGLQDRVIFCGWVENERIDSYIDNADIGVLPLWKLSHYNVTVSNKLFDYMACSLPVISSDTTAMARIVKEANCGLVFEERNAASFIACVRILCDVNLRRELGANGRNAVESTYNWKRTSKVINEALVMVGEAQEIRAV